MEDGSQMPEEQSPSVVHGHGLVDSFATTANSVQPAACALCCRDFSPDNPVTGDCELCGDCKFLCLENLENPTNGSPQRRISRQRRRSGRRTSRYSSSESIEDLFSQRFSQMISMMRQNHAASYEHEEQYIDGDTSIRSWQQTSSRSTPSGSRRWYRMLSDTESDGFDNMDSLYGESESNLSFSHYRTFNGESDAVSMSTYNGGDSDASVDEQSFLETDILARPNGESDLDSDTDIDPMNAGLSQWDLDNHEEDEGEGEEDGQGEWEETDAEEDPSLERGGHLGNSPSSAQTDRSELIVFPDFEGAIRLTFRGRTRDNARTIISNMVDLGLPSYDGNSGDYLDARGFEELLEHLAENDTSRRGAPPVSVSCINSLPLVTISEEHVKHDSISCAICKDALAVGDKANQLPCLHLYHPSCILPWLSSRNSCPLCRYELPTDDKDYEESKQANIRRMRNVEENRLQRAVEESSYNEVEITEEQEPSPSDIEPADVSAGDSSANGSQAEGSRRRWFHLAATPILGLVGMALVLWLGKPLIQRGQAANPLNIFEAGQSRGNFLDASPTPRENRSRRWWSFF
ncbi:uncharacterized protein LOC116200775 [Punica granatum]|uniref:RING-type E3 ubiquitin transferase n=2 Tax=Punica granatum TaxID=22663 RepID=A0A218XA66_PUNGR|nr:uncharacterized protein LOC116200775 [Punica granatum]OWM81589.1 hypothetical protein CDL15_Pgr007627 [Punica granatum]PKI40998.1 hypothetical protein CRG98_038526 [Punica granatum]